MKIENVEVFGLEASLVASGYSFKTSNKDFAEEVILLKDANFLGNYCTNENFKRGVNLGNSSIGDGEANYLKGIIVQFDLEFSIKAWYDIERYKFLEFVSSMSTMHRITKFDIRKQCNEYVWAETIVRLEKTIGKYNRLLENKSLYLANGGTTEVFDQLREELFKEIIYNIPTGFQFTARMSANYMCLKNIYHQRRHHRLPDFKMLCDWIETLPYFKELCLTKKMEGK